MSRRKRPEIPDEVREWFREQGRRGGKIAAGKGGKRSLETMTKAARIARAHRAALVSAKKREGPMIERAERLSALRAAGKSMAEVAAELGISVSHAYKVAAFAREREF